MLEVTGVAIEQDLVWCSKRQALPSSHTYDMFTTLSSSDHVASYVTVTGLVILMSRPIQGFVNMLAGPPLCFNNPPPKVN